MLKSGAWEPPTINANSQDAVGHIIQQGDPLVNFKYKNVPHYESEFGRYWPESSLSDKAGNFMKKKPGFFNSLLGTKHQYVDGREINSKSVKRYTAKLRGTGMIGKRAEAPRWHLDRVKFKPQIDEAMQEGFKLDLTLYQERLSDPNPAVQEEAAKELKVLKEMLTDAKTMKEADLQKKYNRSVWVGRIAMAIGFGTAASSAAFNLDIFADLQKSVMQHGGDVAVKAFQKSVEASQTAKAIAHGAEQFNKVLTVGETAHQVTKRLEKKFGTPTLSELGSKIGETLSMSSLLTKKSVVSSQHQAPSKYKFSSKSAVNIAIPLTILVLTSLSGPGVVVTAIAVTTTLTKLAANAAKEKYKDQLEEVQLNGESLIRTIEKMIENYGMIFKKEDSSLFQEEKSIKNVLNAGLNQGVESPENLISSFPEENQASAMTLLEAMMVNAANTSYNAQFDQELRKQMKLEGLNIGTVDKLRTRRRKLKAFAAARAAPLSTNLLLKGPVAPSVGLLENLTPSVYNENEPLPLAPTPTPFEESENTIRSPSPVPFGNSMRKMRRMKTRKVNRTAKN